MGIQDRDWYKEDFDRRMGRTPKKTKEESKIAQPESGISLKTASKARNILKEKKAKKRGLKTIAEVVALAAVAGAVGWILLNL